MDDLIIIDITKGEIITALPCKFHRKINDKMFIDKTGTVWDIDGNIIKRFQGGDAIFEVSEGNEMSKGNEMSEGDESNEVIIYYS